MQNPISQITMATMGATFLALVAVSAPANADQYSFNNADFDTTISTSSPPPILDTLLQGSSTNAPFGLTQFNSSTYTQIDLTTGQITFNTDPTAFNSQANPGYISFSGTGSDSNNAIFGSASGTGISNLTTGKQTFNATAIITGGEGNFSGATGELTISFSGNALSGVEPPFRGDLLVSGSFTTPTATVPEPVTVTPLVDIGLTAAILLYWRLRRSVSSHEEAKSEATVNL